MKKIALLYLFTFITFTNLFSQINDSFLESLYKGANVITENQSYINSYGTKTEYGALAVAILDSVDTQVQWIKSNLWYETEHKSGQFLNQTISLKERIFGLNDKNGQQWIVTVDSNSYAPRGIRIHKFENYSTEIQFETFQTGFTGRIIQVYFKFNKIFIVYHDNNYDLKIIKINEEDLTIDSEIVLFSNLSMTYQYNYDVAKPFHLKFENENNFNVYAAHNYSLLEIKVENNTVIHQILNSRKIYKVLGIDELNNNIYCLSLNTNTHFLKFHLTENTPISETTFVDSVAFSSSDFFLGLDFIYTSDGNKHIIFPTKTPNSYFILDNLLSISEIPIQYNTVRTFNVALVDEKPLVFSLRFFENAITPHQYALGISWNLENVNNFSSYDGNYQMGDFTFNAGIGSYIIPPKFSKIDSQFRSYVFFSKQHIIAKIPHIDLLSFEHANGYEYKPGPYTNPEDYSLEIVHRFHSNFYIDEGMINNHFNHWQDPNYVMPYAIKNWPAHGNPSIGQNTQLAPFVDLNENQIYEPNLGEYPSFPGSRCLLNITHQHPNDFSGNGNGLELHTYIYKFDCDILINDVFYVKTEIYNRSGVEIDSLAYGIASDFDLGGYLDDFVGTHVNNGLIYVYNGDNFDEGNNGLPGFGDSIPTICTQFLKGVKFPNNSIDDQIGIGNSQTVNGFGFNDDIIDNEYRGLEYSYYYTLSSSTNNLDDIFKFLNGINFNYRFIFDGTSDPLFYGSNGIDLGTNFTEINNNNPPGDRRIIGSFGSVNLPIDEKITYQTAIYAGEKKIGQNNSLEALFDKSQSVKSYFNQNTTPCGQNFDFLTQQNVTSVFVNKNKSIIVFPNPFTNEINIKADNMNFDVSIYNSLGQLMLEKNISMNDSNISTDELSDGMYIIIIKNETIQQTFKLIKQ